MSQAEFMSWADFYRAHPFDDMHRFHRPAALISYSIAGGEISDRLDWLEPPRIPEGMTAVDLSVFRAFGIKPPEAK